MMSESKSKGVITAANMSQAPNDATSSSTPSVTSPPSLLHDPLLSDSDASSTTSYDSDSDSDPGMQGFALNMSNITKSARRKAAEASAAGMKDWGVDILIAKKGLYDWDVRGKRGRDRLFPVRRKKHKAVRIDEWGEVVKHAEFMRVDEREEEEREKIRDEETGRQSRIKSKKEEVHEVVDAMEEDMKIEPKPEQLPSSMKQEEQDQMLDKDSRRVKLRVPNNLPLRWQKVGGISILPLSGHLSYDTSTAEFSASESLPPNKKLKVEHAPSNTLTSTTSIQSQPSSINHKLQLHIASQKLSTIQRDQQYAPRTYIKRKTLYIGDLRLSDFRKAMHSMGYTAEFKGEGTLLVNGCVMVRKSAAGRIELEMVLGGAARSAAAAAGGLSRNIAGSGELTAAEGKTFDEVRTRIYEKLAVI